MNQARSRWHWLTRWLHWPNLDMGMLAALLLIMSFGLLVLYSASESNTDRVMKQGIRLLFGLGVLWGFSHIPPRIFRLWTPWLYALGLILVLATWFFGVGRGAQRWLDFGLLRFQPSEIMKLAVPMMVAWYLHYRPLPPDWRDVLVAGVIIAVPAFLILRQPDLGTALLVCASGLFGIFLAGMSWRLIGGLAGLAVVSAPLLWLNMHEYQRDRIRTFLDPEADPLGEGWNIIQSKIAVGSGGFSGKGWLQGSQSHLEFLPERSTDFILAVISEEFGWLGVILLFGIYLFVVIRGLNIAAQARDSYGRLLAGSIALTFFIYVMVNAGMVSGALPVVGVPLPLVSYGGTSAVTLLAGFGLLMSIYTHRKFIR